MLRQAVAPSVSIVMASIVMAYRAMAYRVMAYRDMAYIVMAYRGMAYIVMACIIMVHTVMAHTVMALYPYLPRHAIESGLVDLVAISSSARVVGGLDGIELCTAAEHASGACAAVRAGHGKGRSSALFGAL